MFINKLNISPGKRSVKNLGSNSKKHTEGSNIHTDVALARELASSKDHLPFHSIKSPISMQDFISLAIIYDSYANGTRPLISHSLEEGVLAISSKMNDLYQIKKNLEKEFQNPMKIALIKTATSQANLENELIDLDVFDFLFKHKTKIIGSPVSLGFDPAALDLKKINIDNDMAEKFFKTIEFESHDPKIRKSELENYLSKLILAFHNFQETLLDETKGDFKKYNLIISPVSNYSKGPLFHLDSALSIDKLFFNNQKSDEFMQMNKGEIYDKVSSFKSMKESEKLGNFDLMKSLGRARERYNIK